jgi:fermentation-respiration switch protein FrsA (DUF1100 family)
MARIIGLLVIAAILALPGSVYMNLLEVLERQFIFFPMPRVERSPAEVGIPFDDVYFETDDGHRLNGWFVPAPPEDTEAAGSDNADITLLWFHGNAGNIGHRVEDLALFHHLLGVNIFIIDYRGYGNSRGKPSEKGVYQDSRAALAYLTAREDVNPDRIVYYGRSLGAAVAVELALHHQPYGMVLYSPFTSLADMGAALYAFSPVRLLAGSRLDSLARIRQYRGPLLVIHGEADEIIPVAQGERLFAAANEPKRFYLLPGAGHNDGLGDTGPEFWNVCRRFLHSLANPMLD